VLTPAAWLTAISVCLTDEKIRRAAAIARLVALTGLYYLVLGLGYATASDIVKALGMAAFPLVLLLIFKSNRVSREDPRSQREVKWLIEHVDNARAIRDFRVYSRHFSCYRCFQWSAFLLTGLALVVLAAVLINNGPLNSASGPLAIGAAEGYLMLLLGVWTRARFFWRRERLSGSLLALLLTPLRSEEILGGRYLVVAVYFGPSLALWLLPLLATMPYFQQTGFWIMPAALLALTPCYFAYGVMQACCTGADGAFGWASFLRDWRAMSLAFLQMLTIVAGVVLVLVALEARLGTGFFPEAAGWLISIVLCGGNTALAFAWFRYAVRCLDRFRRGDMQHPLSRVMAQQRQKATSAGDPAPVIS
jgi:hypothetical protein